MAKLLRVRERATVKRPRARTRVVKRITLYENYNLTVSSFDGYIDIEIESSGHEGQVFSLVSLTPKEVRALCRALRSAL